MNLEINDTAVKVKKGVLHIYTGVVVEERICKIPVALIPQITWEKGIKLAIINALIAANEYEVILEMKNGKPKEETKEKGKEEA